MRLSAVALLVLLVMLQYRLWAGDGGLQDMWRLQEAVRLQAEGNAALRARNQRLAAEVENLKQGAEAIERRARTDLGMIHRNETYYQFVDE